MSSEIKRNEPEQSIDLRSAFDAGESAKGSAYINPHDPRIEGEHYRYWEAGYYGKKFEDVETK